MSDYPPVDAFGKCHRDGCDELAPWDMAAVTLDDEVYCSPDCARTALDDRDDSPSTIALHDPQFVVDREEIGVDEDAVRILPADEADADSHELVDRIEELYGLDFRVIDDD